MDFRVVEVASTVAIRRALADRRDARRRAKKICDNATSES